MKHENHPDFLWLQNIAAEYFEEFQQALNETRRMFPLGENEKWEWDDENLKIRRIKLPEMEWLPFEEANDELE